MIRFINLSNQITENTIEFAFYNTVTDRFVEIQGNQTWESVGKLVVDYCSLYGPEDEGIQRYLTLIPQDICDDWKVSGYLTSNNIHPNCLTLSKQTTKQNQESLEKWDDYWNTMMQVKPIEL